ncbi:hypothetical protein HD599_000590 [Conyzicola lurida]|uniref:Protein NO VEIN C-terminal domain-containing protein n=1 Tax=Conyzicola lurida TaxID=1172621 RepID=A0A841AGB3_9MICO|nr:DUF3578 domain-containing protein [Conyzicola lurida]MBB5842267.1 hypothetical protein [Conyzicola lurida]
MRSTFEKIFQLQQSWSSSNTAEMGARGKLVRNTLPDWISGELHNLLHQLEFSLPDIQTQGRDATGRKSEIPWVRIHSVSRSPNATEGWYLVYLFDAFGTGVTLSINQGTTRWQDGEYRARKPAELESRVEWARQSLAEEENLREGLLRSIKLPTRKSKLGAGYERGNVFAIRYGAGEIPDDKTLSSDLLYMTRLLATLYERSHNTLQIPGDPAPEILDALTSADVSAGKSRGGGLFRLTASERKAIEDRAVLVTREHLHQFGFKTRDVGATKSYDIDAKRGSDHLFVEVKGTVSAGETVILTRNEVALHKDKYPNNMLSIVTDIRLDNTGKIPVATQGTLKITSPWAIDGSALTALSFEYTSPAFTATYSPPNPC